MIGTQLPVSFFTCSKYIYQLFFASFSKQMKISFLSDGVKRYMSNEQFI